jgi:23S rRNA (cytidine1920-2'-O)/16S rRNA (cytidine1409-2'-O)-methyltransferase
VYAIDVGYGQLAWTLRQDPRVVVMERTNARHLESLPQQVAFASIDVSFISLKLILPRVRDWLSPEGIVVPLIKPQFEAGRRQVGKGGVVRDPAVHQEVLERLLTWVPTVRLYPWGVIRSPLEGPAGNIEFLALLRQDMPASSYDLDQAIEAVLDD